MKPDPEVERRKATLAAEHQRACLEGLDNGRLALVAERLQAERLPTASTAARLAVVSKEIERRKILAQQGAARR